MWQRPSESFIDDIWFKRKPLGKNNFGECMLKKSERAALSRIYTNH